MSKWYYTRQSSCMDTGMGTYTKMGKGTNGANGIIHILNYTLSVRV